MKEQDGPRRNWELAIAVLMISLDWSIIGASSSQEWTQQNAKQPEGKRRLDYRFQFWGLDEEGDSMKQMWANWVLVFVALAVALLSPAAAHAQAENAPDNYGVNNAAPIASNSPAKTDFQGTFSLAKEVQCGGHKLTAGKYTVLVKTVGDTKMVTLQHEGRDIVLSVSKTAPPTDSGHSAILVRHGPGPGAHTLEAVYIESLHLVFFVDESGCTKQMDKMFAGVKRMPIT